jgi:hypothetical protein
VTTSTGDVTHVSAPRAVLLAGIALGTAIVVTAYMDGLHPAIPGMPRLAGTVAGAVLIWVIVVGIAALIAEMLRRHHRAIAAGAARQGKRAAVASYRTGRRHGGSLAALLTRWAGPRWERRHGASEPVTFHDPAPAGPSQNGDRPMSRPPEVTNQGTRIGAPPQAVPQAGGSAPRSTANAPAAWKAVAASTADFEPENDEELLGWMAGEVAGQSVYSESLISVYEGCVNSVGLDPVAMSAVHDVADAAADAATAMAYARQKFAAHYSEVREFVGNGGVMPFDGRWITGEGDA